MFKRILDFFSAVIPFIDLYPPWVKISLTIWIIFTAIIIVFLLFFRIPPSEKQAHSRPQVREKPDLAESERNKQKVKIDNSPNTIVYQAGRDLIIHPAPQRSESASDALMNDIPDVGKAKKEVKITSLNQLEHKTKLIDVSDLVSGYFELSTPPSEPPYSHSSVVTKDSFGTHFFASVRITGLEGAGTLELKGRDVWFAIHASGNAYFIWESEENWTTWRELKIKRQPNNNTLAIHQNGRKVAAFLNGHHLETFTKFKEAGPGPVGIDFKANPKTGGRINFQKLSIWELRD